MVSEKSTRHSRPEIRNSHTCRLWAGSTFHRQDTFDHPDTSPPPVWEAGSLTTQCEVTYGFEPCPAFQHPAPLPTPFLQKPQPREVSPSMELGRWRCPLGSTAGVRDHIWWERGSSAVCQDSTLPTAKPKGETMSPPTRNKWNKFYLTHPPMQSTFYFLQEIFRP